ncbi:MAG: hypothetical protein ACNA7M_16610, partial [Roseovarius sp.]
NHPVAIFGWLTIAVGFTMLVLWVPTEVPTSSLSNLNHTVFNAHKASISQAVMLLGSVMVLVGAIDAGFSGLQLKISSKQSPNSGDANITTSSIGDKSTSSNSKTKVKDRQGKIRELTLQQDGSVTLGTMTGIKTFPSVADAKKYLE